MAADDLLFVVLDGAGGCVVALDEPTFAGPVSRAGRDGIVHLIPDRPTTHPGPPRRAGAWPATSTAASVLLTPLVGVAQRRAGTSALRHGWEHRHRALRRPAEAAVFADAFSAAQTILLLWPRLGDLTPVPTPREALAGSLWTLAELLHTRAALDEQLADLTLAESRLPAGPTALREALADRRARVRTSLADLEAEITRRAQVLKCLAGECVDLIRDATAVRAAVAAVHRADTVLSHPHGTTPAHYDPTTDLAELTTSIFGAYRELTGLSTDRRSADGGASGGGHGVSRSATRR
ncbi:hypothetical protein [Dactylosporangium sp. NPDC005555]|uniref:hypothetical protein n=1 Tax=Dactylosporangium sp. NPDC005555 TaxID=3154889 RepID=UPI0033A7A470